METRFRFSGNRIEIQTHHCTSVEVCLKLVLVRFELKQRKMKKMEVEIQTFKIKKKLKLFDWRVLIFIEERFDGDFYG